MQQGNVDLLCLCTTIFFYFTYSADSDKRILLNLFETCCLLFVVYWILNGFDFYRKKIFYCQFPSFHQFYFYFSLFLLTNSLQNCLQMLHRNKTKSRLKSLLTPKCFKQKLCKLWWKHNFLFGTISIQNN